MYGSISLLITNKCCCRIFGTKGQLDCDGMDSIRFDDFVTGTREVLTPSKITGMFDMRGHGEYVMIIIMFTVPETE